MSTIVTIAAGDLISNSRADLNTNFTNLNSDKIETSVLDTDTALAANLDLKVATQKAVKTYIDTSGGANASTTARGVVEEATQAEVDAKTAAGGTGARLFINPSTTLNNISKLAASGASGSVTNTTDETTVMSVSVPANTLSTSNALRATLFVSNFNYAATEATLTVRAKYGATTLATIILDPSGAASTAAERGVIAFTLIANAATNAQTGILQIDLSKDNLDPDSAVQVTFAKALATGTATEDSTGALNIILTVQWATVSTNNDFDYRGYVIERLV